MTTGIEKASVAGSPDVPGTTTMNPTSIPIRVGKVVLSYLIVFSLFGYYSIAGALAELGTRSAGYRNSGIVWEIQRFLHLPSEVWLQHQTLSETWLYYVLNRYYAYGHFPITFIFVVWVFIGRRSQWLRIAAALSVTTFVCLTVDALFPVAPPRLYAPLGIVDTLAKYGPDIYGTSAVSSIADQYGSMPSIHYAWAVFVAWGVVKLAPKLGAFRWLVVIHPIMMLAAVVLTGNHYWLDCAAGALLVPLGVLATDIWMRRSSSALRARMRRPLLIASVPLCLFGLYSISRVFF